ncbi:MAG: hypothetical protein QOD92_1045 [Acidimicrobiaceae bacterium]|jgi:hypothetical protein
MADDEAPEKITIRIQGDLAGYKALSQHLAKQLEPVIALGVQLQNSPAAAVFQDISRDMQAVSARTWEPLADLREAIALTGAQTSERFTDLREAIALTSDQIRGQLAPTLAAFTSISDLSERMTRSLSAGQFWELQPALATLQYVRRETVEQAVLDGAITAEQVRAVITAVIVLLAFLGAGAALTDIALRERWSTFVVQGIGVLLGFAGAWPQIEKMVDPSERD